MKQFRCGTFETNSSSTHAICIPKKTVDKKSLTGQRLTFELGNFGWECREVDAANYLYTALMLHPNHADLIDRLVAVLDKYGVLYTMQDPIFVKASWSSTGRCLSNGSIDHDYEAVSFVETVLQDEDRLLRYLFAGSRVFTGNDNCVAYENCYSTGCRCNCDTLCGLDRRWDEKNPYKDIENFEYFGKGN